MATRFSGAIRLTDLDDFITPSQECIKPVELKKETSKGAKIKIQHDNCFQEVESGQIKKLEKVQVTLNDCLACSGCITSAEEVLINQQNFNEVIKTLSDNKILKETSSSKLIVVSISMQPVISLAEKYKMSATETIQCLTTLFKNLGADKVVEISIAEDLALIESQHEFVEKYRNSRTGDKCLPVLTSSCPGWICYAEKTHGNFILPFISKIKSPQQIMGSLIKNNIGCHPQQVYHITLMPCYDKKLEASRNEFFNSQTNSKDVDCVITTIELEQLMADQKIILPELPKTPLDYPWGKDSNYIIKSPLGSGSGGFAHNVIAYAAQELFGIELNDISWKAVRNPDFTEMIVEKDSKEVLRFCIANGFRNIQNIVQKLKRGKNNYDYVEIMACPSGCLNGGAQIKCDNTIHIKDHILKLEDLYRNLPHSSLEKNTVVQELYREWLGGIGSDKCVALLHTSYRQVEKSQTALNIKW